ncbi:sensor histidine kinase [Streptomyces sp. NPDC088733]|uniref:sensor histidine kinase n=1 Tax=Streptomyces sp. NPDC088733 TaxID=3365880 RepID=UPI00380F3C86
MASRSRLELLIDIAPAVLLCLLGVVELTDSPLNPEAGPQHLLAVVVTTCALAVRRRHPLTVALGIATAMALTALGAEPSDEVAVLLALIVAVYSAAAYLPTVQLVAAAAANSASLVVAILNDPSDSDPGNVVPTIVLFVVLPAVVGAAYRRRRTAVQHLTAQAEELQRTRDEQARRAVAAERQRIARELHDLVAHAVSVIAVQAEAGRGMLETDRATAGRAFAAIADASRGALVELARLLRLLRDDDPVASAVAAEPEPLVPQPHFDDLDRLVSTMGAAGLTVRTATEGLPRPLDQGVSLCAYRVVQESLTNALKHSASEVAELRLRYDEHVLEIEVHTDAGVGDSGRGGTGKGLVGMWERVVVCGGSLTLDVSAGFTVRVRLPLAVGVPA